VAFIVIHRRDNNKKELQRIADALEKLVLAMEPVPAPDDSMEFVSIDKQKPNTPDEEEMPESARM
jgi:hypothetical protein